MNREIDIEFMFFVHRNYITLKSAAYLFDLELCYSL